MRRFRGSFFFLAALLVGLSAGALAGELRGRVVAVSDGDTIEVLDASNRPTVIRLANIDAPETSCHQRALAAVDACIEARQPFGSTSKKSLSGLVFGRDVLVVTIDGKRGTSYGRTVGTVFVGDVDANYEQVKRGYAWHYTDYAERQQTRETFTAYAAAEESARTSRQGLWVGNSPVAPWDYRHKK